MLHTTNGDSAAQLLRRCGFDGDVLAWRDVLHEGPVPADLTVDELSRVRARFLAASGWTAEADALAALRRRDERYASALAVGEPMVLWFEHDLYDQLQLLDALRRVAHEDVAGVELVPLMNHLTAHSPDELRQAFASRAPLHTETVIGAQRVWAAFTAADPGRLARLVREAETIPPSLPFLRPALVRLLEELPSVGGGLSRCERQLLTAVEPGRVTLAEAFQAAGEMEEAAFLGDSVFADQAARLAAEPHPLVALPGGARTLPAADSSGSAGAEGDRWRAFWRQPAMLTDAGRRVLGGEIDAVALRGVDRWLGGAHLSGRSVPWRWNPRTASVDPVTDGA